MFFTDSCMMLKIQHGVVSSDLSWRPYVHRLSPPNRNLLTTGTKPLVSYRSVFYS